MAFPSQVKRGDWRRERRLAPEPLDRPRGAAQGCEIGRDDTDWSWVASDLRTDARGEDGARYSAPRSRENHSDSRNANLEQGHRRPVPNHMW
jgi:hypothetical protein